MKRADAQESGTALRQARHEHVFTRVYGGRRREPWGRPSTDGHVVDHKTYAPRGARYGKLGDAWLAERGSRRRVRRDGSRAKSFEPARWAGARESDPSTI